MIAVSDGCVWCVDSTSTPLPNFTFTGEHSVLEENCVIRNGLAADGDGTMRIGRANLVQVGAVLEVPSVGDGNVFEPRCTVPSTVGSVGSGCVVGAGVTVPGGDPLPDGSVLYLSAAPGEDPVVLRRSQSNLKARNEASTKSYAQHFCETPLEFKLA